MSFATPVGFDLIDDNSPSLGGNFDVNDFRIVSSNGGNIIIFPDGTGNIQFQADTDSTTFFQVLDSDGGTPVLNVDTVNEKVGIGTAAPWQVLDVKGGIVLTGFLLFTDSNVKLFERSGNILAYDAAGGHSFESGNVGIGKIDPGELLVLGADNGKLAFGAGEDASITYDGTNMVLESTDVGSGFFQFIHDEDAASNKVAEWQGNNRSTSADNDEAYFSFMLDNDGGTPTEFARMTWVATDVTNTTEDSAIVFSTFGWGSFAEIARFHGGAGQSELDIGSSASSTCVLKFIDESGSCQLSYNSTELTLQGAKNWKIDSNGDFDGQSDDQKLAFGAAQDASITYDGTDMQINPQEVGSGNVIVTGDINPEADGTRDLGTQTTAQWANVWSDLINGADISLLNSWRILESEKYKDYPVGIAIGNSHFETGVVTETMPDDAKPVFAVTENFIEWNGKRISNKMFDKLLTLVGD